MNRKVKNCYIAALKCNKEVLGMLAAPPLLFAENAGLFCVTPA